MLVEMNYLVLSGFILSTSELVDVLQMNVLCFLVNEMIFSGSVGHFTVPVKNHLIGNRSDFLKNMIFHHVAI